MRRTLTILSVLMLMVGILGLPAVSEDLGISSQPEGIHCPDHDSDDVLKVEDGAADNDVVLPAGTEFCVKSGTSDTDTFNTGIVTADGEMTLREYLALAGIVGGDGLGRDVSYYVIYPPELIEPVGDLHITKTTEASFMRTHNWSIDKSVDPTEMYLYIDGSGDGDAEWTVEVTYEGYADSDWNISGFITVENIGDAGAEITSVEDTLTGAGVQCPKQFPWVLEAGETLVCTYTADLTGPESGINVAGVFGTFLFSELGPEFVETEDEPFALTGEEPYAFDEPTTEINRFVEVADTNAGFALEYGEVTLDAAEYEEGATETFTYAKSFAWADYGQDECGTDQIVNTASVIGDDEVVLDFATATLDLYIQCYIWESAWAKGRGDAVPESFCDAGFSNWGWTNQIVPDTYTLVLWAGAGQCDTSKGTLAGTVTVVYDDDWNVTPTFNVNPEFLSEGEAFYAGLGQFPTLRNGRETTAPGQYTNMGPFNGLEVWTIAHVNVGIPDPDFGP